MRRDSVPFEHPWDEVLVCEVANVIVGGTPSTAEPSFWDGEIRWMASGDVHQHHIFDVPGRISEKGHRWSNAVVVEPQAVAMALAGQGKTRATVALTHVPICTNQSVALIKPRDNQLDPEFLYQSLIPRYEEMRARSAGGGRAGLTKSILERLPIQLPHPLEQRRIAEILSTLDDEIELTNALIAKHQQIKTGLIHDLFTRGITSDGHLRPTREQDPDLYKESALGWIPKEWEVRPFRSVLTGNLQNGYFKKPELVGTGYKLVNVSELYQPFGIDTDHPNVERVAATSADFHKFGVQEGDLFFTRSSLVLSGIAQCNTVLKLMEPILFECHVIRGKPDKNIVNPAFLGLYFQTPGARRELMSRAKQTTMTTISQPDIVSVPVLRPPLDEQTSIAQRITSNMMSIHAEEAHLTKLFQQKHGLMHDLLTGKVRVKEN